MGHFFHRDAFVAVGADERDRVADLHPAVGADVDAEGVHRDPAGHLVASTVDEHVTMVAEGPEDAVAVAKRHQSYIGGVVGTEGVTVADAFARRHSFDQGYL